MAFTVSCRIKWVFPPVELFVLKVERGCSSKTSEEQQRHRYISWRNILWMLPQTAEMNSKNEGNACKFSTSMTISCEGGVTMSPRVIKPKLVWPWTPASPVFFCSFQQTQLYTTQTSEVLELSICNSIFGAICRLKAVLLVCGCGSDTNIFKSGAIVFCLLCFSKILLYSIFF